ncbi:MAG: helix-turn-helix transcriptional regulator [Chloroflexota bacterium]|nr:helix-turn-helix transcriptional regulator [Chloroflexota bacterium]
MNAGWPTGSGYWRGSSLARISGTRRGLGQKDLAAVLHMDQAQISNYENGRKRPRPETLARILKAIEEWDSHHD